MCDLLLKLVHYHHVLQWIVHCHYYQKLGFQQNLQFPSLDCLHFPQCQRISLCHIFFPFYTLIWCLFSLQLKQCNPKPKDWVLLL